VRLPSRVFARSYYPPRERRNVSCRRKRVCSSGVKILCVSDRVEPMLHGPSLNSYAEGVEAVISCGDLPFDYLEYIVTFLGVPVYYVLGNHDPAPDSGEYPEGCTPLDGRVVDSEGETGGVTLAGLSGSRLYSGGPNQHTELEMRLRTWALSARILRRTLAGKLGPQVFVTHSPPFGLGDAEDQAHVGFESYLNLIDRHEPLLWLHGHVHLYGPEGGRVAHRGRTKVLNVFGHRILEV
jgi:DNA repair exonuclease SbcCD nuclease subunit